MILTIQILSRVTFDVAPKFIADNDAAFRSQSHALLGAYLSGKITAMQLVDGTKRKLVVALKPGISATEKKAAEAEARKVPGFVHGAPTTGLMIARAEAGIRAVEQRINYGEVKEESVQDKSETGSSFAGLPTASKWEKGGERYLASDRKVAAYMGIKDNVVKAVQAAKRTVA